MPTLRSIANPNSLLRTSDSSSAGAWPKKSGEPPIGEPPWRPGDPPAGVGSYGVNDTLPLSSSYRRNSCRM